MCKVDDIAISHVKPASLPLKNQSIVLLKCERCNKSMLSISALNYHKKTAHSDKTFKCRSCKGNRYFKYLKNLIDHVTIAHNKSLSAIEKKAVNPAKKKLKIKGEDYTVEIRI